MNSPDYPARTRVISIAGMRTIRSTMAFTLIELLTVIAIIGILAAITLSAIGSARRTAQRATCISNARQIGMALLQYAQDRRDQLPALSQNWWFITLYEQKYLPSGLTPPSTSNHNRGVWRCPALPDGVAGSWGPSYGVVEYKIFTDDGGIASATGRAKSLRITDIQNPSRTWLVGESGNPVNDSFNGYPAVDLPAKWSNAANKQPALRHTGKANVCMFDGHVQAMTHEQLTATGTNYFLQNGL
ncbi:prepilin-type N-terminal cleavage/methylation domain-containing protein [Opitutaceae bacterium TAV1]|nr:prepilin-type N-terminal cleavage/methylation domain-containing protein [Opitutaceae bacterium TAV1]